MKSILAYCKLLTSSLVLTFAAVNIGYAQVGALNPNPLQPSGVGSGPLGGYSRGGRDGSMGINVGPRASGGNENPADTLLRELYGPGYNRPTGKVRFRGEAVTNARRASAGMSKFATPEGGAVYFATRGDYENQLYRPRQGSYRSSARVQALRPATQSPTSN